MRKRTAVAFGLAALLVVAVGTVELARWRLAGGADRLAERWLAAVAANDPQTALDAAAQLVPEAPTGTIDPEYIALAEREGISRAFLTVPFNVWDFQSWRHAHFFHTLARETTRDTSERIQALFSAVVERIKPQERSASQVPWPHAIWQRGFGVCDRQVWVLCELAYQGGWETQVVYLRDPVTGQSPHTICEIRKGPDGVWFADPYRQVLLRRQSIDQVAGDPAALARIWPDRADFRAAIRGCQFWTPAYPQDYCPRNQRLHERLRAILKDRCPRFGEDPHERLASYRHLRQAAIDGGSRFSMGLWFYPFRLLRAAMRREAMAPPAPGTPASADGP